MPDTKTRKLKGPRHGCTTVEIVQGKILYPASVSLIFKFVQNGIGHSNSEYFSQNEFSIFQKISI